MTDTVNNIGNRLLALRKERGLSQQKVADATGISRRIVGYYEENHVNIPSSAIITLCKYYGVTSDYLLGLSIPAAPAAAGVLEIRQ